MHESMGPIIAKIGDQQIKRDASKHWKVCYLLGKRRIDDKEAVVDVHHQRDNKEHVK